MDLFASHLGLAKPPKGSLRDIPAECGVCRLMPCITGKSAPTASNMLINDVQHVTLGIFLRAVSNLLYERPDMSKLNSHELLLLMAYLNPDRTEKVVFNAPAMCIFAEVLDNAKGIMFRITVVYGFNKLAERSALWSALKGHAVRGGGPWAVFGDFNNVLFPDERIGTDISWAEIKHFQDTCHACGLVTVKTIGNFFTWNNKHEAGSRVFSRIDRVLGNDDWGIEFPDCVAKFLPEGLYDHSPCIITLREQYDRCPRPFKYFNMWALADDFMDVISHTWEIVVPGTPMFCLANKLKLLKKPLKGLNQEGFHNIEHTYSLAHKALLLMQEEMQSNPLNSELCDNERVIAKEVDRLLKAKHQFVSQKANMQWIEDGDDNTAFFHASIKRRRAVNKVFQISDNTGVLHEDPDGINKAFELYYMELLGTAKEPQHVDRSVVQCGRMVQPAHSAILMKPVTPEEIKAAMFSIPGTKAAGPDGYSSQFF
ncbi:uncharacterized protein LOC141602277 [Silene latifolia]|uniref:uncharacterized protein LOC141602277 n=1 Tax=Silene latifolia TaxID=37657 RepID=UPI003D780236